MTSVPGPHDVSPHGVEEVGQVHDMGFLGGVFDDGQAIRQGGGQQNIHGGPHRYHVQIDLGAVEAACGGGGVNKAVFHLNLRPHGGKTLQVLVNGPHPQVTAAGRGHLGPAEAAQQGADEVIGGADLAGQLIGDILFIDMGAVQLHCGLVDHAYVGAQIPHNPQDHGHVADVGNIFDPADSVHQKGCGKNGHSGILRAADLNLAVEGFSTADHVFCQNGTFFYMVLRNEIGSKAIRNAKPGPSPVLSLSYPNFPDKCTRIRRGRRLVRKLHSCHLLSRNRDGRKQTVTLCSKPGAKKEILAHASPNGGHTTAYNLTSL